MAWSRRRKGVLVALVVAAVVGGALARSRLQTPPPPEGLAWGNGRIEATQVDVATKRAGRVAEILVDEGDTVTAGQVVARMDARDLEADLSEAQARLSVAREEMKHALALVAQRRSTHDLASKAFGRSSALQRDGIVARESFDEALSRRETSEAALRAAEAATSQAEAAIGAAAARVQRIETDIADTVLVSTISGPVLYRLAEPGEVLPAGGRVLVVLDMDDVYMTVFLSMRDAGRAPIGARARIVLDAQPEEPLPATLTFVAPSAQFTPKEVETQSEREKLVFRAKVRLAPDLPEGRRARIKAGMPGTAWVQVEPDAPLPERQAARAAP